MFEFWQRRRERRAARERDRLQQVEVRHTRLQTGLALVGVLVAILAIVVSLWPSGGGGGDVRLDDPTIELLDRTWVVEGRIDGGARPDGVTIRWFEPNGDHHELTVPVDRDGRYSGRLNSRDPVARVQTLSTNDAGDVVSESSQVELPDLPPVDRASDVDIDVYNKVVSGPATMREDDAPAYLTDSPSCRDPDSCRMPETDFLTGDVVSAFCQATGSETTNKFQDVQNPENHTSTLWYGIELDEGRVGYLSEVWVKPDDRGGLQLPRCNVSR